MRVVLVAVEIVRRVHPRGKRIEVPLPAAAVSRAASPKRRAEGEGDGSPVKRLRRVSADMPDGDEDCADENVLEEFEKVLEDADISGAVDGKPPEVDEATLARLDLEAEEAEVSRLVEMGVLNCCLQMPWKTRATASPPRW